MRSVQLRVPLVWQIMKRLTELLNILTRAETMPNYNKLQRAICLGLFTISSIISYFNPHMIYIAGFAILATVSFDVVCYFRDIAAPKENAKEFKELQDKLSKMEEEFKSIKGDISIAKIGASIRRG